MKYNKICPYCLKEFINIEGRAFSNHIRWCESNTTNGDKGRKNISCGIKESYSKKSPKIIITKICPTCRKTFQTNNKRTRVCCSKTCAAKYSQSFITDEGKKIISQKISAIMKEKWKDELYIEQMTAKPSIYSSSGEREIREFFKTKFVNDNWTFGKLCEINKSIIISDLYSRKLSICIEYDGIWHFKDINGQLEDKQYKDKLLKTWCEQNNFRLIRISDDLYRKNKTKALQDLIDAVYASKEKYIELY